MIKNVVVFSGASENIDNVETVFHNLSKQQNNIDFITNIKWDRKEPTNGLALFLTPNKDIDLMCAIAQTHKVGFLAKYSELFRLNNQITNDEVFGATIFSEGTLWEYKLDADDYKQITYDEIKEHYIFEGEKYDDVSKVFLILINRKLEKLAATTEEDITVMSEAKITLQDVRDGLAGEIEYMMGVFCEENDLPYSDCERVLEAHKYHTPDGFYHYDFIDDDVFLKCIGLSTGETTIEAVLEQYKNYLEVQESRNMLEEMDFDWDSYCEYCYTMIMRDNKITNLLSN